MTKDNVPYVWQRSVGLLGLISALAFGLFAKGGGYLLPDLGMSFRQVLVPLLAGLCCLVLSFQQKSPWARAGWWKGLFTVIFLAFCLNLLLNLRSLTLPNVYSDIVKSILTIENLLLSLFFYFFIIHVLGNYASSRTHYDPRELSGHEMAIGITFLFLTLVMAEKFDTKPGEGSNTINSQFTALTFPVKDPTGYFRRGEHIIVASQTGLYHSYDGGTTWSLQDGLLTHRIRKLYARANRLLVVLDSDTQQHGGMMESNDEGKTWELVPYPKDGTLSDYAWQDLVCDRQGYCSYVYTSRWQNVANLTPEAKEFQLLTGLKDTYKNKVVLASEGDKLYRFDYGGLWRSQDKGKHWESLSSSAQIPSEREDQKPPLSVNNDRELAEGGDKKDGDGPAETKVSEGDDRIDFEVIGLRAKGEELCVVEQSGLRFSKDQGLSFQHLAYYPTISRFVDVGHVAYGATRRGLAVFSNFCESPRYDRTYGSIYDIFDGQEQVLIVAEKGLFVSPLLQP